MVLSASAQINHRGDLQSHSGLAANSKTFYHGALVMRNSSGLLEPAAASANNLGVCGVVSLNGNAHSGGSLASGTGGDVQVPYVTGEFLLPGSTLGQDDVGKLVFATADDTVDETEAANLPPCGTLTEYVDASSAWVKITDDAVVEQYSEFSWTINLAVITGAADVITTFTPGFAGYLTTLEAQVTTAVTTGSKAASLNAEIGTTNVTGTLALTSANMTPLGAVVSQALSGSNFFGAADTISIESSAVTAFAEGQISLKLRYKRRLK